jgi:mitochondrial import inner membrane translocase subunit TIM21
MAVMGARRLCTFNRQYMNPIHTHRIPTLTLPPHRHASTSNTKPSRRAITVTTDDGRHAWSDLSTGEKAARSTQQTFNFALVAAGAAGCILVSYFLYQELFAPDSKTVQFNHAVSRIKQSSECRELLGPSKRIIAYGEPSGSKWARARPLVYSMERDRFGVEHFRMHFNVEGPEGKGVVNVHMTKGREDDRLEYRLLSLSVPGKEVVYLENKDEVGVKSAVGKMFGVQWR